MKRGDVVMVEWPYSDRTGSKFRPALVVQNDTDNARLTNTILAMITSITRRATEPTQLLVDIATPEGTLTGLRQDSVINCINLMTVEQNAVLHIIGSLSTALMQQVDQCLKVALGLP